MSRAQLIALGAGVLSALCYVATALGSLGGLVLAYLAQLPLFAVGLSAGFAAASIASLAGLVVVAVSFPLDKTALFALTMALPVVVLVNRALLSRTGPGGTVEWYPPGYLLAMLNALALALLVGAALVLWGHEGGMVGAIRAHVAEMARGTTPPEAGDLTAALEQSLIVRFVPAAVLTSWQLMVIVNGLLAQGVLASFGRNLRPGAPFVELELPRWPFWALGLSVLLSLAPGQWGDLGANAAAVAALPFLFLGLSVIHALAARRRARVFILIAVYFFLLIAGWPALIVAALGAAEPWLRLRQRFAGPRREEEDE